MKRIGYKQVVFAAFALVSMASAAFAATPTPNGIYAPDPAFVRMWNDYPQATVQMINNYPSSVVWSFDCPFAASGWGEKGVWALSADGGASKILFPNLSNYSFEADFTITGTNVAHAEGGIQVAPWWTDDSGMIMANTGGEITAWGSTIPSFGFTSTFGITYALGNTIHEKVVYLAGAAEPTETTPATVELSVIYAGTPYTSGVLACGPANPNDPPHGTYGQLDGTKLGGQVMGGPVMGGLGDGTIQGTFGNIVFQNLDPAVPAKGTSWGAMKALYR